MIVPIRFTVLLSIILMLFANSALGQDDPFRAEIGLQVGANSYSGDVNTIADLNNYTKNLDNLSTEVGMLFRYRFSKRLALRAGYEFSSVKGNYRYRDGNEQYRVILNNPLHAVDIWGEFNFFDLENPFFGSRGRKIYNLAGNADKLIYYTLATPIEFDRFDNGIIYWDETSD